MFTSADFRVRDRKAGLTDKEGGGYTPPPVLFILLFQTQLTTAANIL
jgi:hypothetical protein